MKASECSIKIFMLCLCEGKLELVGGEENWDALYTEYIDLSGAADTKECTLLRNIHNIKCRLWMISSLIAHQISWHSQFSVPFPHAFKDFKGYGHRLVWNDDWPDFEKQLQRVETKEKKKVAELDILQKEYEKLKAHGLKAKDVKANDKKDFIKLIHAIEENRGFALSRTETMIDEFAIMVKTQKDAAEARQSQ